MQVTANNGMAIFDHGGRRFVVSFHRTIRLPEDGRTHALPPSLGLFPVKRVDDYADRVPAAWREHGGVFIPLHQREAMWLSFNGDTSAVKVAAGKINAVNGKPWSARLATRDEDYMVGPDPQPWIDGFNAGAGMIRQFVAMPLGMGYTAEAQLTGKEDFGGIQLLVIPPKAGKLQRVRRGGICGQSVGGGDFEAQSWGSSEIHDGQASLGTSYSSVASAAGCLRSESATSLAPSSPMQSVNFVKAAEMGLAAGGQMTQKIYPDPHGIDTWDQDAAGRLYVHIVNAEMYEQITGEKPPALPESAQNYAGPYFGLNDGALSGITASPELAGLKTVAQKDAQHGFVGQQDDSTTQEPKVVTYSKTTVRDGSW